MYFTIPELSGMGLAIAIMVIFVYLFARQQGRAPTIPRQAHPISPTQESAIERAPSARQARSNPPRQESAIEREFRNVFLFTTPEGKEALIQGWMKRMGCSRAEAMRCAIEDLQRENR